MTYAFLCMGIVNGFAYVGSGIQPISLGFLIARKELAMIALFVIPFAAIGGAITIWIWHELPAATKKYIAEVERKRQKQGLTALEIPLP